MGIVSLRAVADVTQYMGALEGTTGQRLSAADAETGPAFCKRATDWWKARILGTVLATAGEAPADVLVTSHGGWIGALVRALVGSRRVRLGAGVVLGHCGNASVTVVEVGADGRGTVVRYADTTHVDGDILGSNVDTT